MIALNVTTLLLTTRLSRKALVRFPVGEEI